MTEFLWLGTVLGVLFGALHAIYVYRRMAAQAETALPEAPSPGIYAAWTLGLWVLFGSYLLALWAAGAVLYVLFKAFR